MTDIDTGTLKTIGRLAMQISARNQIQGIVECISSGVVSTEVLIKLKSGYTLVSVITNKAAKALDLKIGDEVTAIFKSSSVLLTIDATLSISARNKFEGKIEKINIGEINAEVVVDIGSSDKLVSVITAGSIKNLGIKEGKEVSAVIKATDVMIGK